MCSRRQHSRSCPTHSLQEEDPAHYVKGHVLWVADALVAFVSCTQMISAFRSSRNDLRLFSWFFRTALSPFTFQDTIIMCTIRFRKVVVYGDQIRVRE